ncbi:hypothetical protein [Sphaerisporangium fuscum]|uniref:hypothetical protein n=1 Tax=Sphaerisporangium fuscum TaxID=2835868 RepID=UPI001BDBDA01|nr:hypothetical protein [Sphaerisporangium fuscum]
MAPELHYQLIVNRVSELHHEAEAHRRANEAAASRKAAKNGGPQRRVRAVFGKLRTS